MQRAQALAERTQVAHAREVVRRPEPAVDVFGDEAGLVGRGVDHRRCDARARGYLVDRELAIAIEPGVRAGVLVESHHEAAAARAHEKTVIDLAATEHL